MQALIQPEVKLKIASFDNSINHFKEKSKNSKFRLDFKFYQKVFVILLSIGTFLIFPESPLDSESLCNKYHSKAACVVW